MEITDQKESGDFNAELTRLRGDNEAMTQRILALTKVVEKLVEAQGKDQDATNTPMANENEVENPLDDDSKGSMDATFSLIKIIQMMVLKEG